MVRCRGCWKAQKKSSSCAHACAQVSMVDGELLDVLEAVARHVRGSKAPFGGLQLVLTGDFHQLPPVAKGRHAAACALAPPSVAGRMAAWSPCFGTMLAASMLRARVPSPSIALALASFP